jgi:hypothetical protein
VSAVALSEAQLRAQVKSVRDKVPDARVIGVHADGPWTGPSVVRVEGEDIEVAFCPSALAVRERLASRGKDAQRLVVVTDRTENELGSDVLARLARRRLYRIDPWRVVLDLFRARELDPRLPRERWLAEALLEAAPPEGYPPAVTAVLDEDTAWGALLTSRLGLAHPLPDARALLRWTLAPDGLAGFETSPEEFKAAVARRMGATAGAAGSAIARCMLAGRGRDALPIGLVCRVLFGPDVGTEPQQLREAAVRLEPAVGGQRLATSSALEWADAAEAVARELAVGAGANAASPWLDRAETILREMRAEDFAHRSPVLASGFDQRLARFASAVNEVLAGTADVDVLDRPAEDALGHDQASARPDRAERLRMARRLARRTRQAVVEPRSLAEATLHYACDGSFADWGRTRVWDGEGVPSVSEAYGKLSERVADARERENHRFAVLLAEWSLLGSSTDVLIPVEEVLSRVVAPLAQRAPVLLLVADGLSFPVFHELAEDLARQGWIELAEGDNPARRLALAALPSVTEVSRTSLLCGVLRRGASHVERDGFATHPGLVAASRSAFPPVLFHKADLVEAGGVGLATRVRDEIARPARQIVGAVINAVDDHLAKGEQLRMRWSTDVIRPLGWLLDAARDAGRAVVLTSDHGHVLERHSIYRPCETDNRRYRLDNGNLAADEVLLRGPRVLSPWGDRVIAPWSERVRYGVKQNGYHGGVTPQEVVIPLAVLATPGQKIAGWSEIAAVVPEWWETRGPVVEVAPQVTAAPVPAQSHVVPLARQGDLFTPPSTATPVAPQAVAPPLPPAAPAWVDRLLASPTYAAQKRLAARPAVEDERVRLCLLAIETRGGKVTRQALARSLGLPPLRLAGLLAALRRLLNVDGYPVLSVDEASDTIELNRHLAETQFEV